MKIGLIDVDGHHFPNLAIMKLSAWHKAQGDDVEWYTGIEHYDRVYMSKVFTFTPDDYRIIQADKIVKGGTGYKMYDKTLPDEIEHTSPDYSLYQGCDWYNANVAYGFITRGCVRKCPWCIVPQKEGYIKPNEDISHILGNKKKAILMDNNILASDYGISQLEKIVDLKCKVDFNQGLDSRLVTDDVAKLLSKIKWIEHIRFACDDMAAIPPLLEAINKLNRYGIKNYRIFVYLLVQDVNEANKRIEILKPLGIKPFAQPYRDFDKNIEPTQEQKEFAWYVNLKQAYNTTTWKDFNISKRREFSIVVDERQLSINFKLTAN